MTERIKRLCELTLNGSMFVQAVKVAFDREDNLLPPEEMHVKRLCEHILAQEPKITEHSAFTGFFAFEDQSVVGDAFHRRGHRATQEGLSHFYLKPIDNLSTMEWQHATADYRKVLQMGIRGILEEIEASMAAHDKPEELAFLAGLKKVAETMIEWAHKCARRAELFCTKTDNHTTRVNMLRLAEALWRGPEYPPANFYEAVLCIYVCFSADPDSFGTLDRYLSPFYEQEIKAGTLTAEQAKEYLQELFLMVQAATPITSCGFTRGGQSHFCIGGYLPNGRDGFCEMSRVITEAMVDLPTYIPQVTLRWTKKMAKEDFRWMMEMERKDPHKRIAFTNDEKRVKCYTEVCGFPFERAVNYTMVGCNEPAFLGAITGSNSKGNLLHCIETLFHKKAKQLEACADFEAFYSLFEAELFADMERIYYYDDRYNAIRARDINYLSSLFFNDCIENARSLTQGGGDVVVAGPMLLGIPNVIDSLIVVKQFVYDEGLVTMAQLVEALENNWEGYEDIRTIMMKTGMFFGNDDALSNGVAIRLYDSFYRYLCGKKNLFGYPWIIGDLLGYNEHHEWYGANTKATPDGRYCGQPLRFGLGQSEGRDRNGLTALLNAIAKVDPHAIACGSTVTNISIDEQLMMNDAAFEKTVDLFETYFQNGGVHYQLTYVSRDDLLAAKETPDDYRNLRVRVTGFSDYFVKLTDSIQDDIIERTTHT